MVPGMAGGAIGTEVLDSPDDFAGAPLLRQTRAQRTCKKISHGFGRYFKNVSFCTDIFLIQVKDQSQRKISRLTQPLRIT